MNTNFIQNTLEPLQFSETVERAQDIFLNHQFEYFPVVDRHIFMGNLSLEDILLVDKTTNIENFRYDLEPFFVRENYFWLDILGTFAEFETNILPVLSDENEYLGYTEISNNLKNTAIFNKQPGDYLVVRKETQHLSITEITQIIESNQSKILGLFISNTTLNQTEITLKITSGNINAIIQTFRRYGYEMISNHTNDLHLQDLKERSEYLEKYLSI